MTQTKPEVRGWIRRCKRIPEESDGDCDLGLISKSLEKCLNYGYTLKLKLTEFPDRLDMG